MTWIKIPTNGTTAAHRVWLPGLNFHGPECHWDIAAPKG